MNQDFAALQAGHMIQCWSAQDAYQPLEVEKTEGCWIYTKDGRKIFDLRCAHECINLGFRHPKVLAAMKAQMEKVVYVTDDFATEPTARLAEKLAHITPGSPNKKVWFSQSGANAVEAAIKAARMYQYNRMQQEGKEKLEGSRQYPFPYKIISRYRSWHGATTLASSASGDPRRWFQEPFSAPGFVHGPDAYCYRCPFGLEYPSCKLACANYLEQMITFEGGSGKVAAVLVEPVVGSNGIIPPPPDYFPRLREICDHYDILLIVDETMTGMGRTGKLLAIEHYGIEPDIIIMGKALGMYSPLAATIFSEKVAQSFDENIFGMGQSFSGHALSCAAALACLEVLEEEHILSHTQEMGVYLGEKLHQLQEKHPSVGDVRGLGLFYTLEIVKNRETKEPLRKISEKYTKTVVSDIADFLLKEKNIYIPSDKFGIWVVPPLIVQPHEIDFIVEALDEALGMADALVN
ncbi:aminotransferase family protein [Catalinimonas niigatensis]|uniref:aminotransferase family protein n=1 Tax=Catalinimonas niigatensis TaxID=1397264 RepID=UPI002666A7A1|nr:aspartate aminotransferase family protein [Catalinimonas niigatensis]WPP50147.1 aspartate aminotransferase family protein [Catalinimonas niigatensis]